MLASYLKTAGDKGEARRELLDAVIKASRQGHSYYNRAYQRWRPDGPTCAAKDLRVAGRMVAGLGTESVLETGIALHHTYGTPLIAGTALKGLAAHYCDSVWGAKDAGYKMEQRAKEKRPEGVSAGAHHQALFGTSEDSGHIIFHDAWITPESLARPNEGLILDVMTPHHSAYYTGGAAPTDFDEPQPIAFLSVSGVFRIAVSCDVQGEGGEEWARLALVLLAEALAGWGIGGKTNAGYGRLT
jgi:CRISPR-associated protein Cmr6